MERHCRAAALSALTRGPILAFCLAGAACSSAVDFENKGDGGGPSTSGGASNGAGGKAAGGGSAAGGSSTSSGGRASGGESTGAGGRTAGAGGEGSGGRASGGAESSGGAGGASASGGAGVGGESAGGGPAAGGAPSTGQGSAGCGKAGRPSGGTVTVANDHIYKFPADYDGDTPYPLFFGFHACGNPLEQFVNLTNGSVIDQEFVRAVGRSSDSGGCWNYNNDISKVKQIYDDLLENYCIDTERVFASGHSSGAQMIVQILTHQDDAEHFNFAAVAPIAASDYGALQVAVPVMYIQGQNDTVRGGDGASTVARFRTANGCEMQSSAYSAVMGCQSGGTQVNPGCVEYQGCTAKTVWCSHNDPSYSNTSHGIPCFAVQAMYDFFTTLP